jgi:organic hydroperoxide reductase OsmC/OhrA
MGAIELAASQRKITLPAGLAVGAEIDLNIDAGSFFLRAPSRRPRGGARARRCGAQDLPVLQYSKATHGNIEVQTTLV